MTASAPNVLMSDYFFKTRRFERRANGNRVGVCRERQYAGEQGRAIVSRLDRR